MIQLTDNAVAAIKTAISRASDNAAEGARSAEGLRIMVIPAAAPASRPDGARGPDGDGDEVVRQNGVTLFIDSESQPTSPA